MEKTEKEWRCINCIWRNSQPNRENMIYCKYLQCGVYANSVPCRYYELYDPEDIPF